MIKTHRKGIMMLWPIRGGEVPQYHVGFWVSLRIDRSPLKEQLLDRMGRLGNGQPRDHVNFYYVPFSHRIVSNNVSMFAEAAP